MTPPDPTKAALESWKAANIIYEEHPEGAFADTDAADRAAASVIQTGLDEARAEERQKWQAHIQRMQADMVDYLRPDGPLDKDGFVERMIYWLDGPEQREVFGLKEQEKQG